MREVRVRVVELVQIDVVGLEVPEALLDLLHDAVAGRLALQLGEVVLGGDDRVAAPALERLADVDLALAQAVGDRRVDEVDADVQALVDDPRALRGVGDALGVPEVVGPEADDRDVEAGVAELAVFHRGSLLGRGGAARHDSGCGVGGPSGGHP